MTRFAFDFGGQNVTEAGISPEAARLGIFVVQEADPARLRATKPKPWRVQVPKRDRHQAICWDTRIWRPDGPIRSTKIHGSGKGYPTIPDGIATPARWVHAKRFTHRATGTEITVITSWWINSWNPARTSARDRWTPARAVLAHRARRTVRKVVRAEHKAGRLVFFEGDLNSITARITFRAIGLTPVPAFRRGLDRMFHTRRGVIVAETWRLPKVGVGGQMQHHGLAARFQVDVPSKEKKR